MSGSFILRKSSSLHSGPAVSRPVGFLASYRVPTPSAAMPRLGLLLEKKYTGFVLVGLLEADSFFGARKTLP